MFYGGMIASLLVIVALIYVWIKWDILQIFKDLMGRYGKRSNASIQKHMKSQTSGKLKTVTSEIQLRPNENNENNHQNIAETEPIEASYADSETTLLQDEVLDETTLLAETTLLEDESLTQTTWLEEEKTIVVVHAETIEGKESETCE